MEEKQDLMKEIGDEKNETKDKIERSYKDFESILNDQERLCAKFEKDQMERNQLELIIFGLQDNLWTLLNYHEQKSQSQTPRQKRSKT